MGGVFFITKQSLIDLLDFPKYNIVDIGSNENKNIDEWMDILVLGLERHYTNIFIPIAFGNTLSDFLGLRLALHIRTSSTINQLSNIFLYGTESFDGLKENEFFFVLRMKGVLLVDYNLNALQLFSKTEKIELCSMELKAELEKVSLKVPLNLFDNHSVANIWGMYRLLEMEGINPNKIKSLKSSLNSIYFKWIMAKNLDDKLVNEEIKKIRVNYAEQLPGLKIIGKIDLEKKIKR